MPGAVPDVLIYGDTMRLPDLRHEVPVSIPDPFLYAEREGRRYVVVSSFEAPRIEQLTPDLEIVRPEELGYDELIASGMAYDDVWLNVVLNACRRFRIASAITPPGFPLELADFLRSNDVELRADRTHFYARRRVKNEAELAGIRRAQKGTEAAMSAVRALLRRADGRNGAVYLDGETLTCERLKTTVEEVFAEHNLSAEEFIVSHGSQTAIGHDPGSGPIAPGEPIVLDLFPRDRESGCYADMTRTYVIDAPPDELVEYHRLTREALEQAITNIRPGMTGKELHRRTCELFERHGYPTQLSKQPGEVLDSGFFHSLGHGVGLEVHEQPGLGRTGEELVAGDVVAVEPGLYRRGFGGCRLEDLVLVTETGGELLTDFPYDLQP
jgi:Xaa-Pro aminopeptidase